MTPTRRLTLTAIACACTALLSTPLFAAITQPTVSVWENGQEIVTNLPIAFKADGHSFTTSGTAEDVGYSFSGDITTASFLGSLGTSVSGNYTAYFLMPVNAGAYGSITNAATGGISAGANGQASYSISAGVFDGPGDYLLNSGVGGSASTMSIGWQNKSLGQTISTGIFYGPFIEEELNLSFSSKSFNTFPTNPFSPGVQASGSVFATSPISTPEPTSLSLLALSSAPLLLRRRK